MNKEMNNLEEKDCDILLDAFYKCMTTKDNYMKHKCDKMEHIVKNGSTTFLGMYIECRRRTQVTNIGSSEFHYKN